MGLLDNPLIQSAALPLLSALLLAPVLRRFAGPRAASGAVVLALCAGYVAIQGWPPWLPRTSTQKLPGLVLAALLVGWALDSSGIAPRLRRPALVALVVLGTGWLGWPLLRSLQASDLALVAAVSVCGSTALLHLDRARGDGLDAPVMLLAAALGSSAIAIYASSALIAQLCGALAAALSGFLLWNWPRSRDVFAGGGVCGAGAGLIFLLSILAFYTRASNLALLLVCAALAADALVSPWITRMEFPLLRSRVGRPFGLVAAALVPVALALAVAHAAAGPEAGVVF